MYGAVNDRGNLIPALDLDKIAGRNLRRQVDYATSEPVGTIVVDPYARYLYLVQPGGKALRYSVGVGRAGLTFKGDAKVAYKSQWPRWTPTANMIKRNPDHYAKYAKGLEGGIRNPLGARALYLYRDGKDTLYRIHGTNEPWSVGKAASSGCIRLYNQDILDLYKRIPRAHASLCWTRASLEPNRAKEQAHDEPSSDIGRNRSRCRYRRHFRRRKPCAARADRGRSPL